MIKLGGMQKIGRALLVPIAVMPAAALLLRLGSPDIVQKLGITGMQGMTGETLRALFSVMGSRAAQFSVTSHCCSLSALRSVSPTARESRRSLPLSGTTYSRRSSQACRRSS